VDEARLVAATAAAGSTTAAGRRFFAEKYVIVQCALERVALPSHFFFCQIASLPWLYLGACTQTGKKYYEQ
jgi:hypothetical protein